MKQEEAKRIILAEWYKLPPEERKTENQAAAFAFKLQSRVRFKYSGDPFERILGWLMGHIGRD